MASSTYAKNAIILGLPAAIGPFAIDMYLPALPTITLCALGALGLSLVTLRRPKALPQPAD